MNLINSYNYQSFTIDNIHLSTFQKNKFEHIFNQKEYNKFFSEDSLNYFILYNDVLIGFFSLNINNNLVELLCLYVFKEFRNNSLATYVLNDIVYAARRNASDKLEYIVANSFVDSSMFFLKNGFDFCKINKKLDYKKKECYIVI